MIINRDTLSSSPEDYLRNQGYQAIVWIGEGGPVEDEHQLIITPEEISRAAGGNYGLSQIITEQDLPDSILYCWHGINDYENLRRFLDSSVQWGEVDVRVDPESGELISRHDSLARSPRFSNEEFLTLRESLVRFKKNDRGVKVDLKMGGAVVAETLKLLKSLGFSAEEVWFHADIQVIGIRGFNSLVTTYPYAMVQTTIDPLAPFIAGVPPFGKWMLRFARHWGVNRFLQTWKSRYRVRVLERMERWGLPVNLYQIPDLEEFLKAVLLLPSSITTDFNFPEWGYYGRGSGQNLQWHEYPDHC
ncbi:MAG: DUF2181 domain-containing protein [Candidatus Marinimicrobia bacterium]|nr:DUF2181 domain-containing protein [Candidatus Neomarinimicrobiota bacterium]MCF7828154.1 DUF2181 domain-containing protein [Candidatus Neomarinimicrobiota bacterium]MCF7879671.1 DUF2181 domain-containing protein [Candidatus Neomarinimicrobiota bacterium]